MSAGADKLGTDVEKPRLRGNESVEALGTQPPAAFRIPTPRPAPRTWRVDQDRVGGTGHVRELLQLFRRVQKARFNGRARSLGSRPKLGKAGPIAVGRKDSRSRRGAGQRK